MSADENPVATSAAGPASTLVAPATTLRVTLRRDFPLRSGEQLGLWGWTRPDRTRIQTRINWPKPFMGKLQPGQERPLEAEEPRAVFAWGIGDPNGLGSPGDKGGAKTTDDDEWGPIAARIELTDPGGASVADGQTRGKDGQVDLTTTGLAGSYTLKVTPDDLDNTEVGPDLAKGAGVADLLYRGVDIPVTLSGGRVESVMDPYDPPSGATHARIGNRAAFDPTTQHLPLSLKPVWMHDPNSVARATGSSIQLVIIHHTGGPRLGNSLNSMMKGATGSQYVIDIDGHIIKLALDEKRKSHVNGGKDRWSTIRDLNNNSIGIEIVNPDKAKPPFATKKDPPYTPEQTRAVIELCERLVAAHPGIEHRIVGHSDVALGGPGARYGDKRENDPGLQFEWERLEARGLGMVPGSHFDVVTSYGGVFNAFPGVVLQRRDRDFRPATPPPKKRKSIDAVYGGVDRSGVSAKAIAQLQEDLRDIGYMVLDPAGRFRRGTSEAVDRFKRHFFSGTRGRSTGGNIDQATAARIKDVVETLRAAP